MKKLIGMAMLAGATIAGASGVANAEGSFSGNVSLTTDYVFRGITQTDGGAAVQGGLDYTSGIFYAGAWASNVNFGATAPTETSSLELDLYAGVKPTAGPVALDFGVLGYFYPNADDDFAEFDYYELKAAGSITPVEGLSVGAALYYSPEFFGETGEGLYYEINGGYALTDALSLKAAYGVQDVDDYGDSYQTWTLGASYAVAGFTLGASYIGSDAYDQGYVFDETSAEDRFVFSIGRAL